MELHAWYVNTSFKLFGIYFAYIYVVGFILAVVLLSALYFMLYRTRFGASVRASLADQTAAALVGIDVRRVSTICFGIGVAVTAAGGMIYGATNAFNASTSYDLISRLLIIIVLGGMGSLGGALVAAIAMITDRGHGRCRVVARLVDAGLLPRARGRAVDSTPGALR